MSPIIGWGGIRQSGITWIFLRNWVMQKHISIAQLQAFTNSSCNCTIFLDRAIATRKISPNFISQLPHIFYLVYFQLRNRSLISDNFFNPLVIMEIILRATKPYKFYVAQLRQCLRNLDFVKAAKICCDWVSFTKVSPNCNIYFHHPIAQENPCYP